jgi:hypothetical protein
MSNEQAVSESTHYLFDSSFPRQEHAEQIGALGVRLILAKKTKKKSKRLLHNC